MNILVDYRPALRERTGVGEYVHQLVRAYTAAHDDTVSVFTSSWKDRPSGHLAQELGARVIDARVPVRLLNLLWHRAGWPPVETLAGETDVVHAAHPLLIPARRAAQVITIHDLFFLSHPERTHAEIRRDYAALVGAHARRADAIVTSTAHGRRLVTEQLGVDASKVHVCPPGAPRWQALGRGPNVPRDGYVLFVGTLEPRKNIGLLLDAYERLIARGGHPPPLVLAGRATADAGGWLTRLTQAPLAGLVTHRGYVPDAERERLYAGARLVVLPSLDEGFGLTALEAMSAGVPLLVSNRGSLPEVVADGGSILDTLEAEPLAAAIAAMTGDDETATRWARAGLTRAAAFTWPGTAATLRHAYTDAIARRRARP